MTVNDQESSVYIPIIGTEDFAKNAPELAINPAVTDLSNTVDLLHQRLVMMQDNAKTPVTAQSVIAEYSKMKHDPSNEFYSTDSTIPLLHWVLTSVMSSILFSIRSSLLLIHFRLRLRR